MSHRDYVPGPAAGARIDRQGTAWTLVLVRDLKHPPELVWDALTDPAQLRAWAPFDADANLGTAQTARLTTVGAPAAYAVTETVITRAEKPRALEYTWGGGPMRWELEPQGSGTRLTLWAQINKAFIAMGATGWHVAFEVLERFLDHAPIGRLTGPEVMQHAGWQRLHGEYQQLLGVQTPTGGA